MLSRVSLLSGLEEYMAGREERAGQIGIHALKKVMDYSAADIRLDSAEEAVLGLGRCAAARELPETAIEAAQALGFREGSPGAAQRGSLKQLPPLGTSKEDLRAAPVETRARPTWLDAVQLHGLATPAVNGSLTTLPTDPESAPRPASPPRLASRSMSPDAVGAPFAAFSPSGGDISAISCRYLGGFGETNGFDSPVKTTPPRQSQRSSDTKGLSGEARRVHGYRRQKTYHERLAEQRRRYMTKEYAKIRAAREAQEAEELRILQERRQEEERAKEEWNRRREQALRRKEEEARSKREQDEQEAAVSLQAGTRRMLTQREHQERLNTPVALFAVHGGPGSGKTTVCERLVELAANVDSDDSSVAFKHLSSGRLLRSAVRNKSHPEWLAISACMQDGNPVPDQIVLEVMMMEIKRFRFQSDKGVCLLDNFPLNTTQMQLLERQVCRLSAMLVLAVSDETMLDRVQHRVERAEQSTGRVRNGTLRPDDMQETAHTNIARYHKQLEPLLEEYEHQVQAAVGEQQQGQPGKEEVNKSSIGAVWRIDAERAVEEICDDIADRVVQILRDW